MSVKPQRSAALRQLERTADPLALYRQLTGGGPDTVLLESRDGNGRNDTQSLLMVRAAVRIESRRREVTLTPLTGNGSSALEAATGRLGDLGDLQPAGDGALRLTLPGPEVQGSEQDRLTAPGPLDVLRLLAFGWVADAEQPDLLLPGQFAWDFLGTVEELPEAPADPLGLPDMLFWLPEIMVRIDHASGGITLTAHGYGGAEPDTGLLDELAGEVESSAPSGEPAGSAAQVPSGMPDGLEVDLDDEQYRDVVGAMKRHIVAGDVFQIVPSRTFRLPCPDPLGAYGRLREMNPSPYLFYSAAPDFTLFGSSPETCVRVAGEPRTVSLFPIAGTRPRGRTAAGELDPDLDNRFEAELKLHGKELAEHMMLVDLARNDVARISEPGTRRVSRLLEVERYSHVMHLVSLVEGRLRGGLDALHAYLATTTMGTLTGAPKIEAARLLRAHEPSRRGLYGGAVGYLTSGGEMDTAIVIRSAVVTGGSAHIRAGAGIVHDSDPQAEADETRGKANAVIQAVAAGGGDR
jgi:anthranilate synthase component 1